MLFGTHMLLEEINLNEIEGETEICSHFCGRQQSKRIIKRGKRINADGQVKEVKGIKYVIMDGN